MKKLFSAVLAGAMMAAASSVPAALASDNTMTAYFEDFESGSVGQLKTAGNAADLSVVDYKYTDGTTGKLLKVVSNGSTGNAAVMYDPADLPVGKDGVRIVFDFLMTNVSTNDKERVDATGAIVPGLLWSENKAVHSNGNGSGYWFTDKNLWKFDRDTAHFGSSGNFGTGTDKWWKLVQDYDFKNKKYTAVIFNTSSGDIYGNFSRDLTALESTDKFDRAAIILPVKDSVTYIDNFTCEPLNKLDIEFSGGEKEVEMGEGSAVVSALNGWITAVSVDGNAKELGYKKNESVLADLSDLSEGKHKLTTTIAYNDGTTETTDTYFWVVSSKNVLVNEDFNEYSVSKNANGYPASEKADGYDKYFFDNKARLITNKVVKGDNLDYVEVHHKADGLMESVAGASGEDGDYALKLGVTATTGTEDNDYYDGIQLNPAASVAEGQFVIEMDIMASANTQVQFTGMAWDNGNIFTNEGGTLNNRGTASYVPDKWKKLRFECDYENTADYCRDGVNVTTANAYIGKVYYDDKYIGMIQLHPSRKYMRLTVNNASGNGYFAVDNVQIYKKADKLYIDELDYTYENGSYAAETGDMVIPAGTSKLVVKTNKQLDAASSENISLKKNRNVSSTITIEDGNIVIVPDSPLSSGSYTLTIAGTATVGGKALGNDAEIKFTAAELGEISAADGTASAYIMSADGNEELTLIVGDYEDNALTGVTHSVIKLKKGLNHITAALNGANSKAMLWNGLNTMKPAAVSAN